MKLRTAVLSAGLAVAVGGSPVSLALGTKDAVSLTIPLLGAAISRADPANSRRVAAATVHDSGSLTGVSGVPVPSRSTGLRLAADSAPYGLAVAGFAVRLLGFTDPRGACFPVDEVVFPEAPAPVSAEATAGRAAITPPTPRATANAPTRPM
ncbi:hypothetical protein ACXDF8_25300 [Mycolicibacterium sp. CBM1]